MKMQERLSDLPPESSNSTSIKNDIFNEVMGPNARDFHRIYGFQNSTSKQCQCQSNKIDVESIRQEIKKEFEDRFAQMEINFEMIRRHLEICPLKVHAFCSWK